MMKNLFVEVTMLQCLIFFYIHKIRPQTEVREIAKKNCTM